MSFGTKYKSFFYLLRTACVCQWILEKDEILPIEFQKVLEMKGIRKVDQIVFVDHFKKLAPHQTASPSHHHHHNIHSSSSSANHPQSSGEESRIKKLENLIKKKLWYINKRFVSIIVLHKKIYTHIYVIHIISALTLSPSCSAGPFYLLFSLLAQCKNSMQQCHDSSRQPFFSFKNNNNNETNRKDRKEKGKLLACCMATNLENKAQAK